MKEITTPAPINIIRHTLEAEAMQSIRTHLILTTEKLNIGYLSITISAPSQIAELAPSSRSKVTAAIVLRILDVDCNLGECTRLVVMEGRYEKWWAGILSAKSTVDISAIPVNDRDYV
ncbi:hypothetical protein N7513_006151 [Penicillium frequentans]|nr:hypothetical protein N7513_006151 [Penicillium glabrum]